MLHRRTRTFARFLPATVGSLALLAVTGVAAPVATTGTGAPPPTAGRIERTGTLVEAHGDDLAAGVEHGHAWVLRLDDGTMVDLDNAPDHTAHGLVGRKVKVSGQERPGRHVDLGQGGTLAPADGGTASGSTGGTVAALAPGAKTVAVVLLNFTDDQSQPWTVDQARQVLFTGTTSVNAYYQDASDGQVSVTGDVFGYVTVTKDNVGCDWSQWGADARAAALAAGAPLGNYTYTVYAWPRTSLCGWAGLGYLPGTSSYIDGYLDTRVVGHELGHNFGVHHASSLSCVTSTGAPAALGGTCTASEYGDPYSIMGSSTRLHNNWHRAQLGWSMGTVTATTTLTTTLAPADSGTGTRLVRVPRGDGTYLNLEYRQPTGLFDNFSSLSAVVGGVSVRVAPDTGSIVQSQLIDVSPTSPASFDDPVIKPGSSFTDPMSGVTISVLSASSSGASVLVDYGVDTQAPSAPGGLAATTATTTSGSSATLSWSAATDNRGVAGYRVYRDGALVTTTTALSTTVTGLAPGTAYTFGVEAFDAAGNTGPRATVSATTPTLDTTAPTAPTGLSATVTKAREVRLSWTASTDNVGVTGYTLTRAGKTWTVTGTSATDKPGRGTFTYTVVARDAAGNRSAPTSLTVTVR